MSADPIIATPERVEAGRRANVEARASDQRAKRSTTSNRLRRSAFRGLTITIPFKHLRPDNAKYGVMRGRMLLRPEYRQAKDTIQAIARRAMQNQEATVGAVQLHARLYMPDARRRDATNYVKLVHDSLQGAVYADDTQITSATWENAGIDRDNPRCEITISPRAA